MRCALAYIYLVCVVRFHANKYMLTHALKELRSSGLIWRKLITNARIQTNYQSFGQDYI